MSFKCQHLFYILLLLRHLLNLLNLSSRPLMKFFNFTFATFTVMYLLLYEREIVFYITAYKTVHLINWLTNLTGYAEILDCSNTSAPKA